MTGEHLQQPDVVLVELVQAELRDHDDADDPSAERERDDDLRLVDRVGAGQDARELAVGRVPDQERLACFGDTPRDSLADLADEDFHRLTRLARELPDERDRDHVVSFDEGDAAVVVVDQRPQLGRDHVPDLAHVVEPVQLPAQALQHLHVRN